MGGTVGLLSLYFVTMTLLSGWGAAVEQFNALWYLMVPLAVSFGIQVGLYTSAREGVPFRSTVTALANKKIWKDSGSALDGARTRHADLSANIAASGTSSSLGMLACCAHHATDVLPFLGLSGASIFLTQYQKPILIASLGINAVGIGIMIKHIKNAHV